MRSCLTCGGRNMRSSSDSGRGRASPRRVSGERAAESSSFYHVDYATYDKLKASHGNSWWQRANRNFRRSTLGRLFALAVDEPTYAERAESMVSAEFVALQKGEYSVKGSVELDMEKEEVMRILRDFEGAPKIFNNVLDTQVLESVRSSKGQRTLLMQRLTWEFLVFRGSFFAHLWVDENDADGTLDFVLKESSFMSTFRGCWTVTAQDNGRTLVEHSIAVTPKLQPPPPVSYYTKRIFVQQERQLLIDLTAEVLRCGGRDAGRPGI